MAFDFNKRISGIPSWILYSIVFLYAIWDFAFTYYTLKTTPGVREGNFVHVFFLNIFGLEYFLYMIPIVLVLLYIAIKVIGRIVAKGAKGVKGENHIAIMFILVMSPNIIFNQIFHVLFRTPFVRWRFNWFLVIAIGIIVVYSFWLDRKVKGLRQ